MEDCMIDDRTGMLDDPCAEPENPDGDPALEWWDEDRMPWWEWPPEATEDAA
jgi:hypothetical protein